MRIIKKGKLWQRVENWVPRISEGLDFGAKILSFFPISAIYTLRFLEFQKNLRHFFSTSPLHWSKVDSYRYGVLKKLLKKRFIDPDSGRGRCIEAKIEKFLDFYSKKCPRHLRLLLFSSTRKSNM